VSFFCFSYLAEYMYLAVIIVCHVMSGRSDEMRPVSLEVCKQVFPDRLG